MEKMNLKIPTHCQRELSSEEWARLKEERANSLVGNLTGYDCPKCLNRGYTFRVDENNCDCITPCSCLKIRDSIRAAERSGLRGVIDRMNFDGFLTTEPWQKALKTAAENYVRKADGGWFFVGGNPGSGKTHICTAMCGAFIKAGFEVRYFVWPSDIRKLKSMVNESEYDRVFDNYANAHVLYIDDLFKLRRGSELTSSDINRTFELINHRDRHPEKLTIISSEHNIPGIIGFDEAIGSRIWANARGNAFDLGKDRKRNFRLYGGDGK